MSSFFRPSEIHLYVEKSLSNSRAGMLNKSNGFSVGGAGNNCRHVMFLLSSLVIGGSERKTVRIANALAASGWKLTVAYLNAPHTLRSEISKDIEVICLDRKGKFGIGASRRLIAYVSDSGVNAICCMNTYPLIYGYLARVFLKRNSFSLLVTINETKFVRRKDELKMILFAPMLRRVEAIIFGSAYQKELWMRQYRLYVSKCTYIHNGVEVNQYRQSASKAPSQAIRKKVGIPEKSIVVGSIGRFRREKQYQFVIYACAELREIRGLDVHCVLVGGGFEEQLLRELVVELGCETYVHLIDAEDDVRPYLEVMDIFVLSSISETFSNAALEAMAMSLPVVLPRVGGCPEMVKPGITGFIYEPGDLSGFVDYLFILGSDEERRMEIGKAARRYVETDFRFESMVTFYLDLFEKAV